MTHPTVQYMYIMHGPCTSFSFAKIKSAEDYRMETIAGEGLNNILPEKWHEMEVKPPYTPLEKVTDDAID